MKKIKLLFLGDGGAGKTTLINAIHRASKSFLFREDFSHTVSTLAISTLSGTDLQLKDDVDYKVWDFAGQMEYGTIHQVGTVWPHFMTHPRMADCDKSLLPLLTNFQHFLSESAAIYIVVFSLARDLKKQVTFWFAYLQERLNLAKASLIVVGSKADYLSAKDLQASVNELESLLKLYNFKIRPIITSSRTLDNISTLRKTIRREAHRIIESTRSEIPNSYLSCLDYFQNGPRIIKPSGTFPDQILSFLHNIGEIVWNKSGGMFSLRLTNFSLFQLCVFEI